MVTVSKLNDAFEVANELDIAALDVAKVYDRLKTTPRGLTNEQAKERLQRHGANTIEVAVPASTVKRIVENFLHTMAILLWITGGIAFIAQMPQLAIAIWLVNLINGTFSFWQEHKAEKAVEALNRLLPATVKVMRNGVVIIAPATALVPGDVVLLSEGDRISADMRLVEAESVEVDQSTLTGESRSVRKNALPVTTGKDGIALESGNVDNLLFAATSVVAGHGHAVVYSTGTATEFGRIAHLTQTIVDQTSPMQKEMVRITHIVTLIAVSVGVAMFCLAKLYTHAPTVQAFIFSLGMVVAFVPEGMVPTVTLALALAVQRMVKQHALVKRLSSVETLGCTNVICTDKTGTLTENQMTVTDALAGGIEYSFSGLGYTFEGEVTPTLSEGQDLHGDLRELLKAGKLCNNASIMSAAQPKVSGDPTEIALLVAAVKAGLAEEAPRATDRIHENVFDSRRKCMSTVHKSDDAITVYIKGSPAKMLERSNRVLEDGIEIEIDDDKRKELTEQIDKYAKKGLRVIAAGKKELQPGDSDFSSDYVESNIIFLGLFAMFDPPRKEVAEAVKKCRAAGIQVVMITGDYEVTAEAIARQVGIIIGESPQVITGPQLERMTGPELVELLTGEIVFARVNPEHKLRIVEAFQRCGKIVAVTGDGVNDAPALKKANIGVAMGIAGADVAKESADMILLDDNFASIVKAIEEGRAVYDNIKKFAVYVFNSNMAEAVPFVVMLLSGGVVAMPLTVMQILSIDLGTDMVPALGLGADPAERGIMQRNPRSLSQSLLSPALLGKALLWYGAIEAAAGMSGYFFLNWLHGWPQGPLAALDTPIWKAATTMTLSCIVCSQVAAVFCCRTQRDSLFSINPFENRLILLGVAVELILLGLLIYVPFLQDIFSTAPLSIVELSFAFAWIPAMVALDEARKLILRKREKACVLSAS